MAAFREMRERLFLGLSAAARPIVRRLAAASAPLYRGTIRLPGLAETVDVCWDKHGVPHVAAKNEADLFMAQGYLHAQERLWQMELSRCFLSGRSAEIFGPFALPWRELSALFRGKRSPDLDFFMRLIGLRHGALHAARILRDEDRRLLEAYSAGVNRYIEGCGKRLPWEFRLLRHHPEPWRVEDSLTIGKGFAFLLSPALFTRLNMIALSKRLRSDPQKLRSLHPMYPHEAPAITQATWDSARGLWQFTSGNLPPLAPAGAGSNSWVLAPERSAGGSAVLCNDPHLRLTLPAVWYLMHLELKPGPSQPEGYEVWGASIPGIPCVQVGANRWIAWGVTAALCDDAELYSEKVDPLEPDRYFMGGQWLRMETRAEVIRVRGRGEIKRIVRSTRHGPVVSDFEPSRRGSEVLSFRWTAHDPSEDFRALYTINRAKNWEEFLHGLEHHGAPTLSYVYADRKGNIGYSLAGKIPLRPSIPTLLPLEGWRPANDWRGYIPFAELPRLYNPPEGAIATANHRVADQSYPHFLSHFFEPPYRIDRIRQCLAQKKTFSVADMERLQNDIVSLHAKRTLETLAAEIDRAAGASTRWERPIRLLLQWDGTCAADSPEAAIFHVFYFRLMANLLVPALGERLFSSYIEIFNQCMIPVDHILKNPRSPWFARLPRHELVERSLAEACSELAQAFGDEVANWRWGRIHSLSLDHSLSRLAVLRPILSLGPFPTPGDNVTINMGFQRHSNPYHHTIGPSLRLIIELKETPQIRAVLLPGQSGHPFSPHYADQSELWRNGRYISLGTGGEAEEAENRLVLSP
ncbi:MAG TPA: penicillin acylase family protein [Candidatus Eisenbacteria bacterium]|nr:penicillin acylase family protein [Candidatus Eisenbacteria bacterium]